MWRHRLYPLLLCSLCSNVSKGVTHSICLYHLASPCRVSMLLHVLRWSYGKVLLLPSCSVVQPCPSSSLETWPVSDSSRPRRNTHTHLHPHQDGLRHQNQHPSTPCPHPPQRQQQNRQRCPGRWEVFVGEPAQQTRWTLSSQSVR